MFCLRSWLPALLFFPLYASPYFVISFFVLTFLLQRPCLYCSALLIVLFCSSCSWASSCFFDFDGNWFEPRLFSSPLPASVSMNSELPGASGRGLGKEAEGSTGNWSFWSAILHSTASAMTNVAAEGLQKPMEGKQGWGCATMEWLRNITQQEFRLPCINVQVRL